MARRSLVRIIRSVVDVLGIMGQEGGRRALVSAKPRSIASFRLVQRLKAEGLHFNSIVDGGANVGQFARAASSAFPGCPIYSFEPLPEVAEKLRKNLADIPEHRVFEMALGNTAGEIEMGRCSDDQSSSILARAEYAGSLLEGTSDAGTQRVRIGRLDEVLREHEIVPPLLIKLDLQGYELEALRGATEILKSASHVLVETVFTKVYEGEPHFEEIWCFLREHGFRFVRPLAFARDRSDCIVQADMLFEAGERR